jgi:hypothetical protein
MKKHSKTPHTRGRGGIVTSAGVGRKNKKKGSLPQPVTASSLRFLAVVLLLRRHSCAVARLIAAVPSL